jgi:hypothetical protein
MYMVIPCSCNDAKTPSVEGKMSNPKATVPEDISDADVQRKMHTSVKNGNESAEYDGGEGALQTEENSRGEFRAHCEGIHQKNSEISGLFDCGGQNGKLPSNKS